MLMLSIFIVLIQKCDCLKFRFEFFIDIQNKTFVVSDLLKVQ